MSRYSQSLLGSKLEDLQKRIQVLEVNHDVKHALGKNNNPIDYFSSSIEQLIRRDVKKDLDIQNHEKRIAQLELQILFLSKISVLNNEDCCKE